MLILDDSNNFSPEELNELESFVTNDILSKPYDRDLLEFIKIYDYGNTGYDGFWNGSFRYSENTGELEGVWIEIHLNYFYLKTIEALKETLAHEYGHHWTLLYCALNRGYNPYQDRLPEDYYNIRCLNAAVYSHDGRNWCHCDKEIIAEDYRFLFAPSPYNGEHDIITSCDCTSLSLPDDTIKTYISDLSNNSRLSNNNASCNEEKAVADTDQQLTLNAST